MDPARRKALLAFERAIDSELLKALSEPVRVQILSVLIGHGACDVGFVASQMPQERSVISRHLKVLSQAGLVRVHRDGRHRVYEVIPGGFVEPLEAMLTKAREVIAACCPPSS